MGGWLTRDATGQSARMAASKLVWKVFALGSGLMAATVTGKVLDKGWRKAAGGSAPPRNPAAPGTPWKEAIAWSAASGTALAMSRMLAQQGAARAWRKTTGSLPPGVSDVGV